ncbi:MAG: hypothetical protein DDT29_01195 [Dehalococcoidia bacterium]|nr:hypothetical protein [Bacillota bacterium]
MKVSELPVDLGAGTFNTRVAWSKFTAVISEVEYRKSYCEAVPVIPSSPGDVQPRVTELEVCLTTAKLITADGAIISGGGAVTVKPPGNVPVPTGVVTETSLVSRAASGSIVILAVIWVALPTVNLLTVIPAPKPTAVAPVKLVPVMVTPSVAP